MQLRVMTFNVRGSFHEDGENDWSRRSALNVATILKYTPDLIGFQEAQSGNLADYETGLADYAVELGPLSIRQAANYHRVPIYWKQNRFERLDGRGFYLSETPETWSLSWESTLVRAAAWVRLRAIQSGREMVILNTHFPHEPAAHAARTASARLVIRQLTTVAGAVVPRIVLADFNALPTSAAHQVFLDAGYTDTYSVTGNPVDASTFHGFRGEDFAESGLRIDWILTRNGIMTHDCQVITDAAPPLYPSDHYPVLAELEIP